MKDISIYDIPFVGLKLGEHRFHYQLDDEFFELFENPMIQKGDIELQLDFHKKSTFFELHFNFSGFVETACDRCAEDFKMALENHYRLVAKFNRAVVDEDDNEDIIWVEDGDTHINIAEQAYELAVLSLPIQKMHPDTKDGQPGCSVEDLLRNEESGSKEVTDPRWEALKKLKK